MSVQSILTKPEPMTSPEVQSTASIQVAPQAIPARNPWPRRMRKGLTMLGLTVLCYFVISQFFLQSVTVVGQSMAPTLRNSEHYLLNRWVYHVRYPQRGEVVVLRDLLDGTRAVKRIVAAPGDSIQLKAGRVYRNGQLLEEDYLAPGASTYVSPDSNQQSFQCGKDQYFVLGDNRMNSIDSRTYGPVPRANILGELIH